MRTFVIPWFIFINVYGCIALANQISDEWLNGSKLPMYIAIPILFVTNLMAGKLLKKPSSKL
jgi:hypothetical protein